jgi:hypothetical protein
VACCSYRNNRGAKSTPVAAASALGAPKHQWQRHRRTQRGDELLDARLQGTSRVIGQQRHGVETAQHRDRAQPLRRQHGDIVHDAQHPQLQHPLAHDVRRGGDGPRYSAMPAAIHSTDVSTAKNYAP